ncbi:50S ribosomal protein L15 [Mycoplasma flocculare]|uniref:Large ribosomal subunit protein uL15 n=2 Tax=Mesomycoplasma flocculare TaxID=2128 RepID=A0A0A8E8P7_MESFC|nr:50S ribosomal protein L15 [Mesomycoplasma flocculare]MXR39453.1 50S ribosomal protein L15 [Mycoplasma sp. MF12]AJC49982.1 50S ribosomal protein L15 [Mesomycoplasma flocculare ATCC 27399]ENX50951.1 50S ribosomal protein L15 [Mesomycoplasma flocculare ATCC 27716]MXR05862.1 50S ribosomal protein L15 [Mesomycoplasma flocculare]MXR12274.1 50S ribosomal protein L15 [Mesomycoplasma flocculare]
MSIRLENLIYTPGSRKEKHRKGRGHAAGKGKQAGRGQSGQKKRSTVRLGFEGGQNPWFRRVPKIGFYNFNAKKFEIFNLSDLESRYQDGDKISLESLYLKGILKKRNLPAKLLAKGELTKKLTITTNAYSAAAHEKITKLGGKIEVR